MTDYWWEPRHDREPTAAYLGRVLDELGPGFAHMATKARGYHYDDFFCPDDVDDGMNIPRLVADLHRWSQAPLPQETRQRAAVMIEAAKNGEFDGTREESDAWAASPDGQAAFRDLHNEQPAWMHGDAVVACADLVNRCGASDFALGFLHDDVPVEEAAWYAQAMFKGARVIAQDHRAPSAAALALAEKLLAGGQCRCGKAVTLDDAHAGCRWQLMGKRWEPGCSVPSIHMEEGTRGDLDAMRRAMPQPNRRDRRARKKARGK